MNFVKRNLIIIIITLVTFLFSLLYLAAANSYWKVTPDSVTYVLAGESLAAGQGYTIRGAPVVLYPPVTSLIFGLFISLFQNDYLAINVVTKVFVLLSLAVCFVLFKADVGRTRSMIIILLSLGSVILFRQSTFLLSDIFYMFFSTLALLMTKNVLEKDKGWSGYILVGVIALFACMTRVVGLTLPLAILIFSLISWLKERTRAKPGLVLAMLVVILFTLIWEYRNSLLGIFAFKLLFQKEPWVEESGYLTLFGLANRFFMNLSDYGSIGTILTNRVFESFFTTKQYVKPLVLSLACFLFCLGLLVSMRKKLTVTHIYLIIYLLIIGLYQPGIEVRYMVPVLPFLFFYASTALEYTIEKAQLFIGPLAPKIIQTGIAIYIVCFLSYGLIYMLRTIPEEHRSPFGSYPIKYFNYDVQRLAMWLKDNSAPEESYIYQHPAILDIITERKGFSFPFSRDPNTLLELLKNKRIRYVLIDKEGTLEKEFLLPIIMSRPDQFNLIKDKERASLYEFEL